MMKISIETLSWDKVRQDVQKVNAGLAFAIDDVDPNQNYHIYKVRYPFGAKIFEDGNLKLPNAKGVITSFNDPSLADLAKQLSYRTMPIGIVVKKSLENYAEFDDRIIPITLFNEGSILGAWEALDPPLSYFPKTAWNLNAGARSIFMLPKISEIGGNKKLRKEYGVSLLCPKMIKDHWTVFRDLANHDNFSKPWHAEVLFLAKKWHDSLSTSKSWVSLRNFLLDRSWQISMFWRHEIMINLAWQKFAADVKAEYLKIDPSLLEMLKHLITIGVGALPAFVPADVDEITAPIESLQKVYLDCYGLKYVPTIMRPHHFDKSSDKFCYYSLREPTFIESAPRNREIINFMQTTRELQDLFNQFKERVMTGKSKFENTPVHDLIKTVDFEFFHTDPDLSNNLRQSHFLPREDAKFMLMPKGYGNRQFCEFSSFVKGCVRLHSTKVIS
jgi:hypothetical protein